MPFQLIKKLEQDRGNLHDVIPLLVEQYGQIRAGQMLGVSATTISRWLKEHGYERRTMWVRNLEKSEAES
jgi:predicted transcriptional regulator